MMALKAWQKNIGHGAETARQNRYSMHEGLQKTRDDLRQKKQN